MKNNYNWEREALQSRLIIKELEDHHKKLLAERDEARENYRFMVERAADQRLDGYRELADKLARAENEIDYLKSLLKDV